MDLPARVTSDPRGVGDNLQMVSRTPGKLWDKACRSGELVLARKALRARLLAAACDSVQVWFKCYVYASIDFMVIIAVGTCADVPDYTHQGVMALLTGLA